MKFLMRLWWALRGTKTALCPGCGVRSVVPADCAPFNIEWLYCDQCELTITKLEG